MRHYHRIFILFSIFAEFIFRNRSLPTADLAKMGGAYALERNGRREVISTGRDLPSALFGERRQPNPPPDRIEYGRIDYRSRVTQGLLERPSAGCFPVGSSQRRGE